MTSQEKFGFIIHPEEWKMVRDVMAQEAIANALFPVLDACLLREDPSEAIGAVITKDLCARMFWDRNVRDIEKYEKEREGAKVRWERFKAKHNTNNALPPLASVSERCNASYSDTDSNTNTNTNTNKLRTVPDKGVKGESASVRLNVFSMSGEEFFSGKHSTLELCKAALGDGFWAKSIRQLGDTVVLEELWAFVSEVRAGESVDNPGAVMTKRLKDKGVK